MFADSVFLGGTTYCSIASLHLASRLSLLDPSPTLRWLVMRQVPPRTELEEEDTESDDRSPPAEDLFAGGKIMGIAGVQGRVNKDPDSCYSFWVGASLKVKLFRFRDTFPFAGRFT
jgi:geranylgeranyl transferase type-1 subunit beta